MMDTPEAAEDTPKSDEPIHETPKDDVPVTVQPFGGQVSIQSRRIKKDRIIQKVKQ